MVLQDTGNSAPDGFPDNMLPSEQDMWASSTNGQFDSTLLPQPLPVLGIPLGFSTHAVRFKTEATIRFAENSIKRKLDQEESQALAYYIYQLEQTKSYAAGAASAIGTWRWYTTWERMKFPMYQPKLENIDPNKFAFFRGPSAKIARQTWRFSLYFLAAGYLGSIVGQLYAQPIAAVKTANDPKLQRFAEEVRAIAKGPMKGNAELGERRREAQRQMPNRTGERPSPQNNANQAASAQGGGDHSSPTAWNDAWSSTSTTDSWEGFSNDPSQQGSQQQNPPQRQQVRRSWDRRPPSGQSAPSSSSPSEDDASPTGGFFQEEVLNSQPQPQPQSKPGESAWDRLRRGGATPQIPRPPQSRERRLGLERDDKRESPSGEDPFNFSDEEEERKRERERAQREFDARVERERQGRDFESEENKKW